MYVTDILFVYTITCLYTKKPYILMKEDTTIFPHY